MAWESVGVVVGFGGLCVFAKSLGFKCCFVSPGFVSGCFVSLGRERPRLYSPWTFFEGASTICFSQA
jgi:hypothetical protein